MTGGGWVEGETGSFPFKFLAFFPSTSPSFRLRRFYDGDLFRSCLLIHHHGQVCQYIKLNLSDFILFSGHGSVLVQSPQVR